MINFNRIFFIMIPLTFISGCDYKDMANYVAKEAYNELVEKHNKLIDSYNGILNENKILKRELRRFKKRKEDIDGLF